jgi:hypothetical protein
VSSTTNKIGGAVVVGVLVLLLGLGLGGGGPGSEPEPEPEQPPLPTGPRPRLFLHLLAGPRYLISGQVDGGEPRSDVSREQAVQALQAFQQAGGDVWIVVHGDVKTGDWESLQRELEQKQIHYYGGPPPVPPEQRS